MPGMAEPDIAIDIVTSASGMSEVHDIHQTAFAPRPRLASLTLGMIGLDAAVTACTAFLCYILFNPARQITSSSVVIPMACLTVCLSLSCFERGLYAAPEIVSRELPWRKLVLAWLQSVAIGTLATLCLAVVSGHQNLASGFGQMGGTWLPAFLVLGFGTLTGARMARLRFVAGPEPLNRTVIIGEPEAIHDLLLRITTGITRSFDVIGIVEHATDTLSPRNFLGLPVFSDLDALERMIRQDAVDTVLVALPWSASDQMRMIIQRISMAPVDVYVYPGMNGMDLPLRRADCAFDLPLLMACTRPIGGWRAFIKRAEDVENSSAVAVDLSTGQQASGDVYVDNVTNIAAFTSGGSLI
ncbi:MAG: polysaccharide biosynthesis protein PslA, partial [Acetobacteraceae bacterium]|nr:polysaccharide biosynthesis protein PslA [Acetobacteraceae bacterium]